MSNKRGAMGHKKQKIIFSLILPEGYTILAKKRDAWLEGRCFLARCHAFFAVIVLEFNNS